jgi:hypothetical protein
MKQWPPSLTLHSFSQSPYDSLALVVDNQVRDNNGFGFEFVVDLVLDASSFGGNLWLGRYSLQMG